MLTPISLSPWMSLSPPHTDPGIEIGLTHPVHTVGEEEGSVTLCVNITSGSTDVDIEIELIIDYGSVVFNGRNMHSAKSQYTRSSAACIVPLFCCLSVVNSLPPSLPPSPPSLQLISRSRI